MDIFRKMKKGLGLDSEASKGNVLGSAPSSIVYSYTFNESGSIGISVECRDNLPVVVRIESKSPAFAAGVIVGDIVVGLNDYEISSYEEFYEIYKGLGRPLVVRFRREAAANNSAQPSAARVALAPEEAAARREAMVRAAQEREAAWSKKVSTASSNRKKANNNNSNTPPPAADEDEAFSTIDAATRDAAVAQVKRQEQETIAKLGYDPYKPLISSNMNPSINTSAPVTPTDSTSAAILGRRDDPLRPEVEEALGVIFSHSDSVSSRTCIDTILKLCRNIYTYPLERKYRTIRMSNASISSKVLAVEGALPLLLLAGFVEVVEDATLVHPGKEEPRALEQLALVIEMCNMIVT